MLRQDRRRPPRLAIAAQAALAAAVASAAPAEAQTYVRTDCRPLVSTERLDPSPLTARWYHRFWTGDCGGLSGCLGGAPNWNEAVGKLAARAKPEDRARVTAQACRLGALIGQEWTRPRKVRRIDSGDLRSFKATLDGAGDVRTGLARVEAKARAKIGGTRRG